MGEATTTSEPGTALASPGLAASRPGGKAVGGAAGAGSGAWSKAGAVAVSRNFFSMGDTTSAVSFVVVLGFSFEVVVVTSSSATT